MTEQSFGIIPFILAENTVYYLLIQHNKGHWGFPKGHAEKKESEIETACREFTEETGIAKFDLIENLVFQERYSKLNRYNQNVDKTVTYFAAIVHNRTVNKQIEEISDFNWGDYDDTLKLITFDEGKNLFSRGHKEIVKFYGN